MWCCSLNFRLGHPDHIVFWRGKVTQNIRKVDLSWLVSSPMVSYYSNWGKMKLMYSAGTKSRIILKKQILVTGSTLWLNSEMPTGMLLRYYRAKTEFFGLNSFYPFKWTSDKDTTKWWAIQVSQFKERAYLMITRGTSSSLHIGTRTISFSMWLTRFVGMYWHAQKYINRPPLLAPWIEIL